MIETQLEHVSDQLVREVQIDQLTAALAPPWRVMHGSRGTIFKPAPAFSANLETDKAMAGICAEHFTIAPDSERNARDGQVVRKILRPFKKKNIRVARRSTPIQSGFLHIILS